MSDGGTVDPAEVDDLLERAGFDPDRSVLTRRQAEVLALRERDVPQREIADALGTSRANISSIEASARRNVERARQTVAVAAALSAPVEVHIEPGTELFDIPSIVYAACDEADTKVSHSSAELMRRVREQHPGAVADGVVTGSLTISVSADGTIAIERRR